MPEPKPPAAGASPGDDLPQELKGKTEKEIRDWTLTAYNRARDADARAKRLEADLARERDARSSAERTIADLSRRPAGGDGDDRRNQSVRTDTSAPSEEAPTLDPWDSQSTTKFTQWLSAEFGRRDRRLWDAYMADRDTIWKTLSHQQGLGTLLAIESASLIREHPELTIKEILDLTGDAGRFNYSMVDTYNARFQGKITDSAIEKARAEERAKVVEEFKAKGFNLELPPPDKPPAPVMGNMGGRVPRHTGAPAGARPKTYADATRQAWDSGKDRMFTP